MIVLHMYVTHIYSMASTESDYYIQARLILATPDLKVEMYGCCSVVLLYILLSSNYPMARAFALVTIKLTNFKSFKYKMTHFPSSTLVVFWAWTHKTTILILL